MPNWGLTLVWTVKYTPEVQRAMRKLDKNVAKEIYEYMGDVQALENPRFRGEGLTANLGGLWRYRVRHMRILCEIRDDELIVLVVHIGKRETVYN